MAADRKVRDRRVPSASGVFIGNGFCAHNANLEGNRPSAIRHDRCACDRSCGVSVDRMSIGVRCRPAQRCGHNPFVLVNYSSTICLNPSADRGRSCRWRVATVGQEKRCDGGPAKSRELPFSRPSSKPSGATRRTARRPVLGAPLLAACAGVQQSLSQFSNPLQFAAPARPAGPPQQPPAVGTGQVKVGADPAAVGGRQCRRRGAIDEERRRDGAGRIPESRTSSS